MTLKLGKLPARRDAVKLKFGAYFNAANLPPVPAVFGHPWLVPAWGMFGNDSAGDCVWAGAAHETMLWEADVRNIIAPFNDASVLSDYSALTGYVPGNASTDKGTDMQQAAAYRQKTGVVDASGARHKIDVYAALNTGDPDELAEAAYLFGAVGVGVRFPQSAMQQFEMGEPWNVASPTKIEGGHYIPCVGRNRLGNYLFVTWGRLQAATPSWVEEYMDEGVCYFSREWLSAAGLSPQGYDAAKLNDDFAQLTL